MAFITAAAHRLRVSSASRRPSRNERPARRRTAPHAVAVPTPRQSTAVSKETPAPRPRTRAPVVESRIASVLESHHWITVKNDSRRLFERAAVAQTDMTRQVEQRAGAGAMHRWVLREVSDPTAEGGDVSLEERASRYVVMETFKAKVSQEAPGVMKRWLSALEHVGPLVNMVDIRTRKYENVFTSKLHSAKFDPNNNIVVVESINVDMSRRRNVEDVVEVLRTTAEASVSAGNCLEFCVLQAPREQGFFKTIEVYKDVDALREHVDTLDKVYARRVQKLTAMETRSRQTFRPVLFS